MSQPTGSNGGWPVDKPIQVRKLTRKRRPSGKLLQDMVDNSTSRNDSSATAANVHSTDNSVKKTKLDKSKGKWSVKADKNNTITSVNFEEGNNFVSMDVSGSISDVFPSDSDQEEQRAQNSQVSNRDRTSKQQAASHRTTVAKEMTGSRDHDRVCDWSKSREANHDHDHGYQHVGQPSPIDAARSELKATQNTLGIMQKYMLKKGIIDSSMTEEDVMKLMTQDSSDSDEEDRSEHEISPRKRLKKKHRERHVQEESGKSSYNSTSETTIYRRAVPCKEVENTALNTSNFNRKRKSDSSEG